MKFRYVSNTGGECEVHAFTLRKGSRSPKMIEAAQSMQTRYVGSETIFVGAVQQRLHLNLG